MEGARLGLWRDDLKEQATDGHTVHEMGFSNFTSSAVLIPETQATPERMRQRGQSLLGRVDKIRVAGLYTDAPVSRR